MIASPATYADVRDPWNGSAWCSHSAENAIGPSTICPGTASGAPVASVGKAVSSFGSPS